MNKQKKLKIIGYSVMAVLILNMVLFAMQLISGTMFWTIIILGGLFSWKGLPWIKEKI